jgi:hypothetical protein
VGRCNAIEIVPAGKEPLEHQVNTANVDDIEWVKGVEFYLQTTAFSF